MRTPFVAGNWKMNKTIAEARAYAEAIRTELPAPIEGVDVAVCPPFTALATVADGLAGSGITTFAQSVHQAPKGAHTGEVSAAMIVEAGASGTIVGHSERRAAGETDELVASRLQAALEGGLDVILCVGESLEQREAGQTDAWLAGQVRAALWALEGTPIDRIAIAYEPIWAIGTGRTATPDIAQEACAHVRAIAAESLDGDGLRILYGGSVTPDNAAELMGEPDIDGALVGGASLDPESFARIVRAS
jgi:triosephosphate isomerase